MTIMSSDNKFKNIELKTNALWALQERSKFDYFFLARKDRRLLRNSIAMTLTKDVFQVYKDQTGGLYFEVEPEIDRKYQIRRF